VSSNDWKAAARTLLARHGTPRDFSCADFGREKVEGAVSVLLRGGAAIVEDGAIDVLREVRRKLPAGTVALLGTCRWLGKKGELGSDGQVELFIAPGKDQFDAVAWARTDAINCGHETDAVVSRLKELDRRYGLELVRAETDTVEGFITGKQADWSALAQELYEFCPDIVDQGVGSVEALEEELEASKRLYLWWD
jgi:hypothetical protein